jgi:hypothetical protein
VLTEFNKQALRESGETKSTNDFIGMFKKHRNITALTREIVTEWIKMIYIENDGCIIEFNFQDMFEQATQIFEDSKALLASNT